VAPSSQRRRRSAARLLTRAGGEPVENVGSVAAAILTLEHRIFATGHESDKKTLRQERKKKRRKKLEKCFLAIPKP
jgi:hypothetical protein